MSGISIFQRNDALKWIFSTMKIIIPKNYCYKKYNRIKFHIHIFQADRFFLVDVFIRWDIIYQDPVRGDSLRKTLSDCHGKFIIAIESGEAIKGQFTRDRYEDKSKRIERQASVVNHRNCHSHLHHYHYCQLPRVKPMDWSILTDAFYHIQYSIVN